MSGSLDAHYDFALLGTSLPLSILSAALSRTGYSVLHIDEEEHYGGPWSSLTLLELIQWGQNIALHSSQGKRDFSIEFPAFQSKCLEDVETSVKGLASIPTELTGLNRHFSISLAPTIVPCAGPTIDVLIRSKVASYCTFRLLQKTAVYSMTKDEKDATSSLKKVPSSKEDIFKDKSLSLVDKRRLMKLLQQAGGTSLETDIEESKESFFDYLLSKDGANLSRELATSVAYGVALCSTEKDSTARAMERIRRHITSIGRYGNAAYLVGQYGGAGEMAQCFCRASAVQGGTFVLGHRIQQCSREEKSSTEGKEGTEDGRATTSNWCISLDGIEGDTRVEKLVGDDDLLRRVLPDEIDNTPSSKVTSVSAILLLDRGIPFDDTSTEEYKTAKVPPPETGLVIFPPEQEDKVGAVTALQMGEGTFSCPKGMYFLYLSASVKVERIGEEVDAKVELRKVRNEVLKLARRAPSEWKSEGVQVEVESGGFPTIQPLMELYYNAVTEQDQGRITEEKDHCWVGTSNISNNATSLDEATLQAENMFWEIVGPEKRKEAEDSRRKKKPVGYTVGRGLGGVLEGKENENLYDFFPSEDTESGDGDE